MDKKNDYQIKYTKLLLFISKLLYPKYLSCLFPLFMFYVYRIQHKLYVPRLKLYSVPLKLFDHIDMNENEYLVSDYQNLGLVSENHYKKIQGGLDLVKATSVQIINNKKTVSETKIIQILPSKAVTKNVLLISETLFFNITKRFYDENVKNEIILRQIDENPKFASKVVVSFVSNQIEYENSLIDSLLSNYFLTPKLLCENDVFEVPIEKYYQQILFTNCLLKNEDRKFYFKCLKLTDERNEQIKYGFCVKGETELSQTHHVQSFAPQSFYKLIHTRSDDFQDYLLVHWPVGVLNVFHDIKQAIIPFLKTSSAIMPDILKPAFLIQGIRGSGKSTLVRTLSKYLGIHLLQIECPDLYSPMTAHIEAKLRNVFLKVKLCSPCLLFLNRFENFLKDEEGRDDDRLAAFFESEVQSLLANNTHVIILICSSNTTQNYPRCDKMFLETFSIEDMSQMESKNTLNWFIKERGLTNSDINLDKIVLKIHGFTLGDLDYLISEVEKKSIKNNTVISDKQFDDILSIMKSMYSDSIGAPKVPKVHWSDIGGLTEIKTEILKTIRFIMHYRHFLKDKTLKRSGILLYGPPGTGKTLIAKAVATECNLNFLSVKGPELLNMYVGQSESNVREVFTRARQAAPCIIFFDELDSLVPNRGRSGDSGGVMDRVVSQLLAEMDGIEDTSTIFIIGATNRPDLIDPGLLRPGRFDKLLYVGVSTNRCSKLKILKALTKKFDLDENTLTNIVDKLPKVVTGADIQAVCSNAWLRAARLGILKLETGIEIDSISKVEVVLDDFIYAIKQLKPSVTDEMLAYYKKMKTNFEKN